VRTPTLTTAGGDNPALDWQRLKRADEVEFQALSMPLWDRADVMLGPIVSEAVRGAGFDRERVVIRNVDSPNASTPEMVEHRIDAPWRPEFLGLLEPSSLAILEAHNFPTSSPLPRPNLGPISTKSLTGGRAWAWIGADLFWADINEHGILSFGPSSGSSPITSRDSTPTWSSWDRATRDKKFNISFPELAPFHVSLQVIQALKTERDLLAMVENCQLDADVVKQISRFQWDVGFRIGAYLVNNRARRLHSGLAESEARNISVRRSGASLTNRKKREASRKRSTEAVKLARERLKAPLPKARKRWSLSLLAEEVMMIWKSEDNPSPQTIRGYLEAANIKEEPEFSRPVVAR